MSVDPDEQIVERIKMRLEALALSERAVTKLAKLSPSAIRNMREGKSRSPRVDTIRKLAPALKVTPEWLTFGIEAETDVRPSDPRHQVNERPELIEILRFIESLDPSELPRALKVLSAVFNDKDRFIEPSSSRVKRTNNSKHS